MRRAYRIAGLLSVAASGTLAGHAVTYFLEGRTTEDGHHGYFSPALELTVASVFLWAIVVAVRRLTAPGTRPRLPALPSLCVALAILQVGAFAALEFAEGNAPDIIGCCIEVLIALLVAAVVSLFVAFVDFCVAFRMPIYLRRISESRAALCRPQKTTRPRIQLEVCAGVRRFKRPPPVFG